MRDPYLEDSSSKTQDGGQLATQVGHQEAMGALIQKNICTPMFIAALFTIAKIWRQLKCSSVDK